MILLTHGGLHQEAKRNDIRLFQVLRIMLCGFVCQLTLAQGKDVLELQNFSECKSKEINTLGGLSNGSVTQVLKSKSGLIWVSTENGLNRLDGNSIRIFRHNPDVKGSLPENQIESLLEDDHHTLWLATSTYGICRFDEKTEAFIPVIRSVKPSQIVSFQIRKRILVVFLRDKIQLFSPGRSPDSRMVLTKTIQLPRVENLLSELSYTWDVKNDGLYLAVSDGEVLNIRNITGETEISTFRTGFSGKVGLLSLKAFNKDCLFAFFNNQLEIRDGRTGQLMAKKYLTEGLQFGHQARPYLDGQGNIWLNSFDGQMLCLNPASFQLKALNGPWVRNVWAKSYFLDQNESLWVGTNGLGLQIFNLNSTRFSRFSGQFRFAWTDESGNLQIPKSFGFPIETEGFSSEKIPVSLIFPPGGQSILVENGPEKRILIESPDTGNDSIRLFSGDGKRSKEVNLSFLNNRKGQKGKSILLESPADLWRVEPSVNGDLILVKSSLKNQKIVATYVFPIKVKQQPSEFVRTCYLSQNQWLWIGTSQGIFVFDRKRSQWEQSVSHRKNDERSLSSNEVNAIYPDPEEPDRYLWIGTENGLNKLETATGKVWRFDKKNGNDNDRVMSILSDKAGNIWFGGKNGISVLIREGLNFRHFNVNDGLQSNEFYRNEAAVSRSGKMFFGGIEGITGFYPEEVVRFLGPVDIQLTGFSVFNQEVDWKTHPEIINQPIGLAKKITLDHTQTLFRIDFSLLDFSFSTKKEYEYLLEGYHKDWVQSGSVPFAVFSNPDPGSYMFKVRGKGQSGIWAPKSADIEIVVLPAWWQTWWARVLFSILTLTGLYGFYRYRLKQELRIFQLRDKLAIDLHDEVGSTLNSIAFFGETARRMLPDNDPVKPVLDRINEKTKEVMDRMSDIVWNLNTRNDTFESVVTRLKSFAISMLEPNGCTLTFQVDSAVHAIRMPVETRQHLFLIAKEAINNASKYSGCLNFKLSVKILNKDIQLLIVDDGNGFDHSRRGTGNGLFNMEKRSKLIRSQLIIESSPGMGTKIEMLVPLPNTYF